MSDEKERLLWSYTKGYPMRWRIKHYLSATICHFVPFWTCAECKFWEDA